MYIVNYFTHLHLKGQLLRKDKYKIICLHKGIFFTWKCHIFMFVLKKQTGSPLF